MHPLLRSLFLLVFALASTTQAETPSATPHVAPPIERSAAPSTAQYLNPLDIRVADPFIHREGKTYYLYGTSAKDGIKVWTSEDLVHWTERGLAFQRSEKSWSQKSFWAPEMIAHNGKYYLHFAAIGGEQQHRRLVLAQGDSPLGPFHEIKAPWFDAGCPTIDSHIFRDDDGQMYLYSVDLDHPPAAPSFEIHTRRLNDALEPSTKDVTLCIKPTEPWEGPLVTEGPFVTRRGDTYVLTYSGVGYLDRNYSVGVATSKSPMGPWVKSKNPPILAPTATVSGPGHHCFINSPDGKEMFIVYHVHQDPTNPRRGRKLAIDRVHYVDGPVPTLKVDGPTDTPQPMPSGAPVAP